MYQKSWGITLGISIQRLEKIQISFLIDEKNVFFGGEAEVEFVHPVSAGGSVKFLPVV